jgi:SNF2 family DNA or RNA helicase
MTVHVSHLHRALVLPFRNDVATLVPHAKRFNWQGADHLAVPHGNDETRLLRNLGLSVPAPIVEHYNWPGPDKPFAQQVKTSAMLTMNNRAFCLNEMGTGKTRSTIWAWDWLRKNGQANKLLIVSPVSTMRFVWQRELMILLPNIKVQVLDGTKDQRVKKLRTPADVYVINHDGIVVMAKELAMRFDLDCLVLDEVAAFRNANARRSKTARFLTQNRRWVWGLTGSPTPTSPTDAYGLAKLIVPATAPKSFVHFRSETMMQLSQFKWAPRNEAADIVSRTLQPSVRFTLEDTVELPQLIERRVDIDQGSRQQEAYKWMKNRMAVDLIEGRLTAANGGVALSKLLQISCGYVYLDGKASIATLDNEERLDTTVELIDGSRGKVIVFAPFIHAVDGLEERMKKEGLDYARVTGETPSRERDTIFRAYQNTDQYDVLIAHPACMAHGITLTAADTIIWFSPITSLEIFEQANARISRVGQVRKQQVLLMQGTDAERRVYSRLKQKRDIQDSVLDLIQTLTVAE